MSSETLITPNWSAPINVRAYSTTRLGGFSVAPYESLNLGTHVGDDATAVEKNRQALVQLTGSKMPPLWLNQVHGTQVISAQNWQTGVEADAIYSNQPNQVCTIMTADCLPVLLCDTQGHQVAAIHAGWRGLLNGVIENTVSQFQGARQEIMAWLGPAIGPDKFEVGPEVREAFIAHSAEADSAFKTSKSSHYLADIYQLATQRLAVMGITDISGGNFCTATEKQRFFSYRRDGKTGRMATLIWISPK
jgi:hypothetical protein